jgi:hypothetical protein
VGLQTIIFAALDRAQARARVAGVWDPRDPEGLPRVAADPEAQARQRLRVSAAGALAASLLFSLCWLGLLQLPATAPLAVTPAPVWRIVYWPTLAVSLASMALAAGTLVRPVRTRWTLRLALARDACGLALIAILLAAGRWVELAVPGGPEDKVARLSQWLNLSVGVTLAVIGIACALDLLRGLKRARHPVEGP